MALIVASKVKEFSEINVGKDVYDKLDLLVQDIIKKGVERAKANNRSTLMAKDL